MLRDQSHQQGIRRRFRNRYAYFYAYPSTLGPVFALAVIVLSWCILLSVVVSYVYIPSFRSNGA